MDLNSDGWVMSLEISFDLIVFGILLINLSILSIDYLIFDRAIERSQMSSIYYV